MCISFIVQFPLWHYKTVCWKRAEGKRDSVKRVQTISVCCSFGTMRDFYKTSFIVPCHRFLGENQSIEKFVDLVSLLESCTKTRNVFLVLGFSSSFHSSRWGFVCTYSGNLYEYVTIFVLLKYLWNRLLNKHFFLILLQIFVNEDVVASFAVEAWINIFCRGAALNRSPDGGLSQIRPRPASSRLRRTSSAS